MRAPEETGLRIKRFPIPKMLHVLKFCLTGACHCMMFFNVPYATHNAGDDGPCVQEVYVQRRFPGVLIRIDM